MGSFSRQPSKQYKARRLHLRHSPADGSHVVATMVGEPSFCTRTKSVIPGFQALRRVSGLHLCSSIIVRRLSAD